MERRFIVCATKFPENSTILESSVNNTRNEKARDPYQSGATLRLKFRDTAGSLEPVLRHVNGTERALRDCANYSSFPLLAPAARM